MNLCKTCGTICPFDDEHEECDNYKPMTNEDWLRSCTTEQLAEFLFIIGEDNWLTDISNRDNIMPHEKDVVEWLKQPHTTIKE